MRHGMHIPETGIVESQAAEENGVDHLLPRFDILAVLDRTGQISINQLNGA
ncbi:hypothetical protein D3C71_2220570 [compost metagenome]